MNPKDIALIAACVIVWGIDLQIIIHDFRQAYKEVEEKAKSKRNLREELRMYKPEWNEEFKDSVREDMGTRWIEKPTILNDNDPFDTNYGLERFVLNDEHLNALKEGKAVWLDINGGEYAAIIMHEDSLRKDSDEQTTSEEEKKEE